MRVVRPHPGDRRPILPLDSAVLSVPLEGAEDGYFARQWTCSPCGAAHDRDVNAAANLHGKDARACWRPVALRTDGPSAGMPVERA
ncbi:zinc ribbon domain-containing protein [Streptomyces sp. NPDC014892]|uniref:zinc ribbon domain-containing protein n=1 Tax=Streptomyces sp. NPDC014892 TaxID=3364930 RepID=UPI0036F9C45F